MDSELIDDDELKEIKEVELEEIKLINNITHTGDGEKEIKEEETVDKLHKNTEMAISIIKKNKTKKIKKMFSEKPPNVNNLNIKAECQSILKSLEDIDLKLNQMDEILDNTVKWVSNICIITILGMIVIVIIMAAAAIIMINKFI